MIRDGRRVANQLISVGQLSKTTSSSMGTKSDDPREHTSASTALEQDFTIEGKKGNLQCPFSQMAIIDNMSPANHHDGSIEHNDQTAHPSSDPMCAAMYADSTSQSACPAGAHPSKCPIRFIDQHSPEEIAHYVETHKHELPRSHEVCLRRYQKNEVQIRKLDSKYGNIVSMIEGLTQLHTPMLPEDEYRDEAQLDGAEVSQQQAVEDADHASTRRVQNWADEICLTDDLERHEDSAGTEIDRQSHFDRPLKEIRVGESPTRPWGISVPIYEPNDPVPGPSFSPPPAPVRIPSPRATVSEAHPPRVGRCPFGYSNDDEPELRPSVEEEGKVEPPRTPQTPNHRGPLSSPLPKPGAQSATHTQPAFLVPDAIKVNGSTPQMVFTGPVFIGYPMEQAIQFMNHYQPPPR